MSTPHYNQRMRALVGATYDKCKPLTKFSTAESDEFWTLAEELMNLEAELRKDPEWAQRKEEP